MKKLLLVILLNLPTVLWAQVVWIGANTHKFSWNSNPSGELVEGYRVYINGRSRGEAVIVQSDVGLSTEVPVSNFNLPEGRYDVYVTAYNPAGESGPSSTIPFVLALSAPGDPDGVTAPTGLSIVRIVQ